VIKNDQEGREFRAFYSFSHCYERVDYLRV